jgi:uncharacterized membrane protein
MILLALAASLVAFYLGTMAGCWLAGRGHESAYLEGAKDGIGFERRRVLRQALREADDLRPEDSNVLTTKRSFTQ